MEHVEILCLKEMRFDLGESLIEEYLKRVEQKEEAWLKFLKFILESKVLLLSKAEELPEGEARDSQSETIEIESKDKVKAVLRRSLQSLPKHKHIFFLSRYAVLEYKNGDPVTGRTNFENLVSSFPNRIDIWGVYLDMEIKYFRGQLEDVRGLFDRILELSKLKMKSAKNVFKKMLKFEELHGGKGRAQYVKKRAQEYVTEKYPA